MRSVKFPYITKWWEREEVVKTPKVEVTDEVVSKDNPDDLDEDDISLCATIFDAVESAINSNATTFSPEIWDIIRTPTIVVDNLPDSEQLAFIYQDEMAGDLNEIKNQTRGPVAKLIRMILGALEREEFGRLISCEIDTEQDPLQMQFMFCLNRALAFSGVNDDTVHERTKISIASVCAFGHAAFETYADELDEYIAGRNHVPIEYSAFAMKIMNLITNTVEAAYVDLMGGCYNADDNEFDDLTQEFNYW